MSRIDWPPIRAARAGLAVASATLLTAMCVASAQAARITEPKLPDAAPMHISEHVYAIAGYPNIGIVTGTKAVLIVDTGLGPENGATVARVVKALSQAPLWYLTTTHFHPEHAAGEAGFPAGTRLIRPRAQQQELEQDGARIVEVFRGNPKYAPYLENVSFRKPYRVFDTEQRLDLGGVHVRLMLIGPAHTRGDEAILVEEDRALFTGDLAMQDDPPRRYAEGASRETWIATLDRLAALQPLHVLPDHGDFGDARLISTQRLQMTEAK